ncbi:MAG TPA: hypothetical protein VFW27_04080 [Actinoplanes sp.]|nr:hypothetical protein [Actinoplanes sp.]
MCTVSPRDLYFRRSVADHRRQAAGRRAEYTTLVVWSKKEKRAVATAEWQAPDAMAH